MSQHAGRDRRVPASREMRQYFLIDEMAHPDDARDWFEEIFVRYAFDAEAVDYFRTLRLEMGTLEAPLGGGYWISESNLVLLRGAQDEAAVHELAHAWWEQQRAQQRDELMGVLRRLGSTPLDGYRRVAELADVYCNGIPSQADPSSPTSYWRGMLAEDNDHETFAGFCSGVMAESVRMPPQLRVFYRGFLKGA